MKRKSVPHSDSLLEDVDITKLEPRASKIRKSSDNFEQESSFSHEDNSNKDLENSDKPPVKSIFSISELRSQLRGPEGLKYLRAFSNCAEWGTSQNDVILDFLGAGGTIGEITALLDVTAQGDLATALPVFRAVFLILTKIQSEATEFENTAKQDAENLLITFVATFQGMLNMNSPKHRKVVLKLLTKLVSFRASFGRQILSWFSLTPAQLEQFTEPGPVRKAFIMFLMSFFSEGNITLFRPLLEKKGLLSSIISSLKYDDMETTVLVLNVMAEKLLTHPKLPKTTKLNIFNTQAIQSFLQLYDWVGPKAAPKGWKKHFKSQKPDPEAAAAVSEAVNKLLLVVCTDRKHGLVFVDKSLGVSSQANQLIFTALEAIPKPWKKEEMCKLVIEILASAPDLIKPCLGRWASSFQPRESSAWTDAVLFFIQVLFRLQPEMIIPYALEVLTSSQLSSALEGILLHPAIIKHIKSSVEESQSPNIRCQGIGLVSAIVSALKKFFDILMKSPAFPNVKKHLMSSLCQILPEVNSICLFWKEKNADFSEKNEIIARYLLELMKLDPTVVRSQVKETSKICKLLIKQLPFEDNDTGLASDILQIVCLLDPAFLTTAHKQFRKILELSLSLSLKRGKNVTPLAYLLLNTGLFKNNIDELDIWVASWLNVPQDNAHLISEVLVDAILEASIDGGNLISSLINGYNKAHEGWSTADRKVNSNFLTYLMLHLSCMREFDYQSLENVQKFLVIDVNEYLHGRIVTKAKSKSLSCIKRQLDLLNFFFQSEESEFKFQGETDLYYIHSVFLITMHFTRSWLSNNEVFSINQSRSKKVLLAIKNLLFPGELPVMCKFNALSIDTSFINLHNKIVSDILSDSTFVKHFVVNGGDNFSFWLYEVLEGWGLTTDKGMKWLPKYYLAPLRERLCHQLRKIIKKIDHVDISRNLSIWMSYLRPSLAEVTPIMESLCSLPPGYPKSGSSPLGILWQLVLGAVISQPLPRPLITSAVRRLCSEIVLDPKQGQYHDALLLLLSNFALSSLDVPEDFIKKIIMCEEVSDNLLRAMCLCVHKMSHTQLVDAIVQFKNEINWKLAVAFIDIITQKSHVHGKLAQKTMDNKKQYMDKRLQNVLLTLARRCWPHIERFLWAGEENCILSERVPVIRLLLLELGSRTQDSELISRAFEKHCPDLDALPALVGVVPRKKLSPLIGTLITDPMEGSTWNKKARAVNCLIVHDEFLKNFVRLRLTEEWQLFVNQTLRDLSVNSDPSRWAVLRTITNFSWSEGANNSELADLFNKCTSHSEFISVMLTSSQVKEELLGLLLAIVRLWPAVMTLAHVPLFLAAYSASLSATDQIILETLERYERQCGSLLKFEPFFWGQSAVSHYSVRSGTSLSLWKQVNMKNVLELMDTEKVLHSISHFPIHRKLHGNGAEEDASVYDPAFLLPLFSNLFSPGAVSYPLSFIHRGGLSFTITALSSLDVNMRAAAAVVLSRFYAHLQLTAHLKQKAVWLHLIDSIRFGLDSVGTTPLQGVICVFLARAAMQMADPNASLYSLHRLLLAKPTANMTSVPEFISLFFSSDLNYGSQKKWMVEVLRDGIMHDSDIELLLKGSVLSTILTSFMASSTPNDVKITICQMLEKIMIVGAKSKGLIEEIGIDLWLRRVIGEVKGPLLKPYAALLRATILYQTEQQRLIGGFVKKSTPLFLKSCLIQLFSKLNSISILGFDEIFKL